MKSDLIIFEYNNPKIRDFDVRVFAGDRSVCFRSPEMLKGMGIHGAVYFNEMALSPAVFRVPVGSRFFVFAESNLYSGLRRFERNPVPAAGVFAHDRDFLAGHPDAVFVPFGTSFIARDFCSGSKSRLVSFVGSILHDNLSGGYRLRQSVARMALSDERIDCFGKGIREIDEKAEGLAEYCFSIAMENEISDCYFTEKLIDCFMTDTVPIYWGTESVCDYFDSRGILFFKTEEDFMDVIDQLSEERYRWMLPYVKKNREIAMQMRLDSYEGLMSRLAEKILELGWVGSPVFPLKRSKAMAGIRRGLGL